MLLNRFTTIQNLTSKKIHGLTLSKVRYYSSPHLLPVNVLTTKEKGSYTHYTMCERTPKAIDKVISNLEESCDFIKREDAIKYDQGQQIIEKLLKLKYELTNNKEIRKLKDNLPDLDIWNNRLLQESQDNKIGYLDASMMYSECSIYRQINGIFSNYSKWEQTDAFEKTKKQSFISCLPELRHLVDKTQELYKLDILDKEKFKFMLYICLWGNQSDLAFFATKQTKDMNDFIKLDFETILNMESFIIANDLDKIWNKFSKLDNGKLDIILDNSGFELISDLLFADYLIQRDYVNKVQLHGKAIPWFVSDTTLPDLKWILELCLNDSHLNLQLLATRLMRYLTNGKLHYETNWFWTSPYTFWHLPTIENNLFDKLNATDVVLFKGDLNYRKLIGDGEWNNDTEFAEAIGPLNQLKSKVVALKTCKSELITGISNDKFKQLNSIDKEWRTNGKYAVIQSN